MSGPWTLGDYRGFGTEHDIERANGESLSGVRGMFSCVEDARLAASAPELLAALTSFVASYHVGGVPPFSVVESAERAIAKAHGSRAGGET